MAAKLTEALLLYLLYLILSVSDSLPIYGCKEGERKALLNFKEGLKDPGGRLSSWIGQDCCIWRGVQCGDQTGQVVQLDLGNKIPLHDMFQYGRRSQPLKGDHINPLLGLKHLQYLDLSMNIFGGFSGVVPHQLSKLSSLRYLDLSSVSNLPCNHLHLARKINLSNCILELPFSLAHVNFTKIQILDLSGNNVHSVVPPWLFKLSSLESLDLSVNAFKELIPSAIGNLTSLKFLNLARNSVLEGGVPLSLRNLCMLNSLDLSANKYLHGDLNELGDVFSGCLKDSLEILSWLGLHSLIKLDISRNTLNGSVPVNLGQLYPKLEFLDFAYNNLTGVLTEAHFVGLTKLQHLGFSANEFKVDLGSQWLHNLSAALFPNAGISDALPDWFWNFSANLQLVDLSHNDIKGPVPQFPGNLAYLLLFSNKITGKIPETLCDLKKLLALDLSKNQLIGEIPNCWNHSFKQSLSTFDLALTTLDLGQNKLSGRIPTWLPQSLLNLDVLRLRFNMLVGDIPPELGNLTKLRVIDFAYNLLSGTIPYSLANLRAMKFDPTIFYNIKVELEIYDKISFDYVDNMEILYMVESQKKMGMLLRLESLDLSNNILSGEIPTTMIMLSFLSHLNLSYNNLSGRIPYGGKFLSLPDPSIYFGNPALCGFPLDNNCENIDRSFGEGYPKDEDEAEKIGFYVSISLRYILGFLILWGLLLLNKKWGFAYFQFVDCLQYTIWDCL
ncbi:probably inactive leucine-rich repeat receptor-like protein kinase At2g25790 [Dioscorea cayenensis subsp. rotundata]|uniref:Probably inactive leucine-rich repeat receptor-like protein kinase At2g25790 n=1 Tax=Dioscorea cayennensis subsp. rotundata TaxID=55577 RepID=A0AB40CCA9_DIOCR|nr:probably inactive leucine-rich repeat receptor-like protein kinase At2g25790 [Dioscorea cayenensis subsp. rotundata]